MNSWKGKRVISHEDFVINNKGKVIKDIVFKNDSLYLTFEDDTSYRLWDNGQDCCEERYMVLDDGDLDYYKGAIFTGLRFTYADDQEEDHGGVHEKMFMHVGTALGEITFESHNEHNGYYGGLSITIKEVVPLGQNEIC